MKIQITFPRICALAMTCCFLFLTRAFLMLPSESSPSIPEPGPSGEGQTSFPLTKADLNTDPGSGSMIDLSQLSDDYTITQAGTYILTGEYNGQISVDSEEQIVQLYHLTTLMITHNMRDAIAHGNRLIMMYDGKIALDISGEDKKKLTVEELLEKFGQVTGSDEADDKLLLS